MALWNESLNTFAALWLETLVRASWQGGLALALVWAVCRLLPRLPAGGRCWLWRLATLKLLLALLWLPALDLPLLPADAPTSTTTQLVLPAELTRPAASISVAATPEASETPAPPISRVVSLAPGVAAWLLLLWAGALLWQVGQAIRQGLTVRRLRRSGTPLDGGQLDFWNVALSRDLNLPGVPRLLSSTATNTPVLIGILQPCILLPEALLTTCTPDELRLILAHELAHVRRRDLLWGWLPLLARLVCGFHPLVRLAEREIGMAQEIACDETALHLTGAALATYGSLLVRVAACFAPRSSPQGFGMIGMTESYHTLKRRLSAMKSFPSAPRHYRVIVRGGLLTLSLAALIPWRVAAQSTPPVPTVPATPMPVAPVAPPAPVTPTMPAQTPVVAPEAPLAPIAPVPAAEAPTVSVTATRAPRAGQARGASRAASRTAPASAPAAEEAPVAITRATTSSQDTAPAISVQNTVSIARTITFQTSTNNIARSITLRAGAQQPLTATIRAKAEETPQDSAPVGYPIAAPGRIAPAQTSAPSSASSASPARTVILAPRSTTTTARASRVSRNRTRSGVTVNVLPSPATVTTTDPLAQTSPAPAVPAVSDPTAPRRTRKNINRSGNDPLALPPVPAPETDPTAAPIATPATAPVPAQRSRRAMPVDPTIPPTPAPRATPADPDTTPPTPRVPDPQASAPAASPYFPTFRS